jgi:hypothetical protein
LAFYGYRLFFTAENAKDAEKKRARHVWIARNYRKSPRSLRPLRFNLFIRRSSAVFLKKAKLLGRGRGGAGEKPILIPKD